MRRLGVMTNIMTQPEVRTGALPPAIDVLLVRREPGKPWTPWQLLFLSDGIRESTATHIIIELKYSESLTYDALEALIGYEAFYRRNNKLPRREVQSVIILAKQPRESTRTRTGLTERMALGVYRGTHWSLAPKRLIVVSELSDAIHNVFLRLFSTQKAIHKAAFEQFQRELMHQVPPEVTTFVFTVHELLHKGGKSMGTLALEEVLMHEKTIAQKIVANMPEEELDKAIRGTAYHQRLAEQNRLEGVQQGLQQGQQHMLRMVLIERFGAVPPDVPERIQHLSSEQMQAMIQVIIHAPSLDAVLEQLPVVTKG